MGEGCADGLGEGALSKLDSEEDCSWEEESPVGVSGDEAVSEDVSPEAGAGDEIVPGEGLLVGVTAVWTGADFPS